MMRVAIETATRRGSVAVGRGDRLLAEVTLGLQTRHAETAVPALDAALRLAGVERSEVEAVVVGAGPGSFTGVRVAGATAKGVAAALDVPLVAYSSLLALVASVPADGPVCGLFDARRGEVYAGCWRVSEAGLEERLAPRVGPLEEVVEAVAGDGESVLFAGDGARRYARELTALGARVAGGGTGAGPEPGPGAWPRASTLLWLAHHHPAVGAVPDVGSWEPAYLRQSSAERGVPG